MDVLLSQLTGMPGMPGMGGPMGAPYIPHTNSREEDLCVVCMDGPKSHIFVDCRPQTPSIHVHAAILGPDPRLVSLAATNAFVASVPTRYDLKVAKRGVTCFVPSAGPPPVALRRSYENGARSSLLTNNDTICCKPLGIIATLTTWLNDSSRAV